jgi:hypothetical protein
MHRLHYGHLIKPPIIFLSIVATNQICAGLVEIFEIIIIHQFSNIELGQELLIGVNGQGLTWTRGIELAGSSTAWIPQKFNSCLDPYLL